VNAQRHIRRAAHGTGHIPSDRRDFGLDAETKRDWRWIERRARAAIVAGDQQQLIAIENVSEPHPTHRHNSPVFARRHPVEKSCTAQKRKANRNFMHGVSAAATQKSMRFKGTSKRDFL